MLLSTSWLQEEEIYYALYHDEIVKMIHQYLKYINCMFSCVGTSGA
jgi:hypothetical protein